MAMKGFRYWCWRLLGGCVAALVCGGVVWAQTPAVLEIVTEELPPLNYTKDGKITGFSTEVVLAALKEVGMVANIRVLPWTRAMEVAEHQPNVLIYSIGRTPEREPRFKWVGQVNDAHMYLYVRKGSGIALRTIEDAKAYRVGTVNGDLRERYLEKKGFVVGQHMDRVNRHENNYLKLKAGRIDVWPMSEPVAFHIAREYGDKPGDYLERTVEMADIVGPYAGSFMAFGLKTPDALVDKLREGLERVRQKGIYAQIAQKWVPRAD